jgi:hypothetical protein
MFIKYIIIYDIDISTFKYYELKNNLITKLFKLNIMINLNYFL